MVTIGAVFSMLEWTFATSLLAVIFFTILSLTSFSSSYWVPRRMASYPLPLPMKLMDVDASTVMVQLSMSAISFSHRLATSSVSMVLSSSR